MFTIHEDLSYHYVQVVLGSVLPQDHRRLFLKDFKIVCSQKNSGGVINLRLKFSAIIYGRAYS